MGRGRCVFGNYDGYLMAPSAIVFPALDIKFHQNIKTHCSLALQRVKMEVFGWGDLPPNVPEDMPRVANKSCDLLEGDLQALWTLLSSSVSQKLGYHLSLQYPSVMRAAISRLDNKLWWMLEAATGLHIPQQDEGMGVECVPGPPAQGLDTGQDACQIGWHRSPVIGGHQPSSVC